MSTSSPLAATWLGRVGYVDGWRLQEAVATRVRSGGPDRLLLLEHDPVYTIGRRGSVENLIAAPSELRARGASVYRVDRGGDVTYHGPGQLVGYPVIALGGLRPAGAPAPAADLVGYVRALEGALIDALATYGVEARGIDRKTGVWVELGSDGPAKIAAIGVRVSRGVSTHGFALNVSTDLDAFGRMIPCGFVHEVASLERLGIRAELRAVGERVAGALARRLDRELVWEREIAPWRDAEVPRDAPVRAAEDLLAGSEALAS